MSGFSLASKTLSVAPEATMNMIRWYLLYLSRWHLRLNSRGKQALPLCLSLPALRASSLPCKIQQDKRQDAGAQTAENRECNYIPVPPL